MIAVVKPVFVCALLLGALALGGCTFSSTASLEEEKEPHFLEGKSRVNTMDYAGALESFEQALEVNPKSAAAHFELGVLCDQKEADPAAAIYHYGRYLKLRPKGDKVDRARSRISLCQQELAQTVSFGSVTQGLQREQDALTEQIKKLTEENKSLREKLDQWEASASVRPAAPPPRPDTGSVSTASSAKPSPAASVRLLAADQNNRAAGLRDNSLAHAPRAIMSAARTHTVSSGETPAAIARKYGIKVDTLMAANPRLDARRLRIGQTLSIPSS